MKKPEEITIRDIEHVLDLPAAGWVGKCYEIACACVEHGLVEGDPAYGHFLGEIEPESAWTKHTGRGPSIITQHGWVVLKDGRIFDPTGWAFVETDEPWIIITHPDEPEYEWYDEGGNKFREILNVGREPPEWTPGAPEVDIDFGESVSLIRGLLNQPPDTTAPFTRPQLFYLSNLPYQAFGDSVADVYGALCDAKLGAFIPYDNYVKAEREYHVSLED